MNFFGVDTYLVTSAQAQEPAAAPVAAQPSPLSGLPMLIILFGALYFILLRPQQKKLAEHKKMVSELRRGDKILTNGGLIGTISKLEGDDILLVEIAPEVKVRIAKTSIASVLTRTEPAGKAGAANEN